MIVNIHYVTDARLARVQEFGPNGKVIAAWGEPGSAPGRFRSPTGIALDAADNVYVADAGNARIQKFPAIR